MRSLLLLTMAMYAFLVFFGKVSKAEGMNDWALTSQEITLSRRNHTRDDTRISTITFHNHAEILLDGAAYMDALYDDVEAAGPDDFVHVNYFEEDTKFMLKPNASDVEGSKNSSVYNLIGRAVKRGVKIRMLINFNVLQYVKAIPFCLSMNLLCGYICCAPDARHSGAIGGNIHTKMWIVKRNGETIVYNGGMDVSDGRWDTPLHNNSPDRQIDFDFFGHTAVHDHMVRLTGPAVVDFERHFYQSWNDPYPAIFPIFWLPKYEWHEPPFSIQPEGYQVQFLRTIACKGARKGYYQNFAPQGEISAFDAFKKQVKKATSYVYIEDQFVNFPEGMKVVADALPHLKAVIVVTNSQDYPSLMSTERHYFQRLSLLPLFADPAQRHKVHIFSLVRNDAPSKHIYIHAKLFVADDQYMLIGSFGMERSGMTHDTEVGMGIYDARGNFVPHNRRRIWAEHLMLNVNDARLDDPVSAVSEWVRQADAKVGRVRHYMSKDVRKTIIADLFYAVYEGEGRCD